MIAPAFQVFDRYAGRYEIEVPVIIGDVDSCLDLSSISHLQHVYMDWYTG